MKFKDNAGKEVTSKEFISRWKDGIKNITPLQQLQSVILGGVIVLIGICWGLTYSIYIGSWWLAMILFGSFIVSMFGTYGNWQRFIALRKIEEQMKAFQNPVPTQEITYVQ